MLIFAYIGIVTVVALALLGAAFVVGAVYSEIFG